MDNLNNNGTLFKWVSSIALPAALTISSVVISTSVERSKIGSDYVRLAVGVLSSEPSKSVEQKEYQNVLKGWAVRILDNYSPVKMTLEEKDALLNDSSAFDNIDMEAIKKLEEAIKGLREVDKEQQSK